MSCANLQQLDAGESLETALAIRALRLIGVFRIDQLLCCSMCRTPKGTAAQTHIVCASLRHTARLTLYVFAGILTTRAFS